MNESKASRVQRARRRGRAASLLSGGAVLMVLAATPAGSWLDGAARSFATGLSGWKAEVVALAVFVAVAVALVQMATVPAVRHFGAVGRGERHAAVEDLFVAACQDLAVVVPASVIATMFLHAAGLLAGRWWWLLGTVWLAGAMGAALWAGPHVLAWLARTQPVQRPELADRLRRLAVRAGVPVARIDEWLVDEGAETTALVAGVGQNRRVLLAAHLARDWSDDEVAVVVAHELAHLRFGDLWRTFGVNTAVIALGLCASEVVLRMFTPADAGFAVSFTWLAVVGLVGGAVWLASAPFRHAQSRHHERRADAFALELTGAADAFAAAVRRLGARHLSEERPTTLTRWLHYRHPSVGERLAAAKAYREAQPRRISV